MKVVVADAFLPCVNALPPVVATSVIARGLHGLYANILQEPLPDHIQALIRRLDDKRE